MGRDTGVCHHFLESFLWKGWGGGVCDTNIQVFRERLSEKVHATTPKGIVGSFECPVLQRNLKELHGRPQTYVCECQRKVKKLVSTATVVRNSVLIISHITFRGCHVHIFSDNLSRNSCIFLAEREGVFVFKLSLIKDQIDGLQ